MNLSPAGWERVLRALILICHIVLGFVYATIPPIFEKNDEVFHFAFARHLAQGQGLPVQKLGEETAWQQDGSQPPLYYALAAPVIQIFGADDFEQQSLPNAAIRYEPHFPGNKNHLVITPQKRAFNYTQTTLSAYALRLLGLLASSLSVWLVFDLARMLTRRAGISFGAMAFMAFHPMYLNLATSVSNDGLLIMWCVLGLWLLARMVVSGIRAPQVMALGLAGACATLTKLGGVFLLPASLFVLGGLALLSPRPRAVALKQFAVHAVVVTLVYFVVCGRWFARNMVLYGELTGTTMMANIAGPRPISLGQLIHEFEGINLSFFGIFGWFNVPPANTLFTFWVIGEILAAVGLVILIARLVRKPNFSQDETKRVILGLGMAVFFVLVVMGFARWAMMTPASQGRLIFAALAPIFIAISAGLAALGRRVLLAGNLLMAAAAIITPWAYIKPAYEPPLLVAPPSDIVIINQPLQPYAEVIGYTMTPAQAQPGQRARVSVYLRALKTPSKNFYLVTKLFGKRAQPLGRFDSYTGSGLFLSKDWKPGDIWKDEAEFTIPLDAETPATLKTAFVLFHPYSGETSVTTDSSGKSIEPLHPGSTLLPLSSPAPSQNAPKYGNLAALESVGWENAQPGSSLSVTLRWRVLSSTSANYTVFAHLLAGKQIVAQADGLPDGGEFPTTRWSPGVVFTETRVFNLPAQLPADSLKLSVGLYDAPSGARLPAQNADGQRMLDDALIFDEFGIIQPTP